MMKNWYHGIEELVTAINGMTSSDYVGITSSFTFWTALYIFVTYLPIPLKGKYSALSKKSELDIQNRAISWIHGLALLIFSGNQIFFNPGQCGDPNSTYEKRLIYTAVGYFAYDFVCMGYYGLLDSAMFFHHILTAFGMCTCLMYGNSANLIIFGMFAAEVSNPMMHMRVILKHLGLRYTKAYEACEIGFIVLYFYGRIICGASCLWQTLNCNELMMIAKFAAVFLIFQSVHFLM
jgi:hypothetical protein